MYALFLFFPSPDVCDLETSAILNNRVSRVETLRKPPNTQIPTRTTDPSALGCGSHGCALLLAGAVLCVLSPPTDFNPLRFFASISVVLLLPSTFAVSANRNFLVLR